ncbi:MAG TPA: 50S ribosomal protein L10, partial [Gammaproteobacteria bacterium]|nr:50S ribosomal protein L10 [Gammaproteobacteria bacterium]
MSLTLEQKKRVVAEVNAVAAGAQTAIAAEYSGLSVGDMTALRAQARSQGVYVRVVKNNLARRAIEGTDFECLSDSLTGPLLLVFSVDDPGAGARVIQDFSK